MVRAEPAATQHRGSALALLVTRVLADDHDASVATDDLALVANLLDAWLDLHEFLSLAVVVPNLPVSNTGVNERAQCGRYLQCALLVAVNDPAAGQIVGAELYDHAVLGEDADVVLAHLAANRGKNAVAVGQLNAEHRVGQSFDNCAFDLNDTVFFGHSLTVAKNSCTGRAVDFGASKSLWMTRQKRAQSTNRQSYGIYRLFAN